MISVTVVMVSDSTTEVNHQVEYPAEKCEAHFICGAKSFVDTPESQQVTHYKNI